MIEGSAASDRAISHRRRSPPDSAIAGDSRKWVRPNSPSNCSSRASRDGAVRLVHLQHRQDILLDGQAAEDRGFLRQIAEAEDCAAVHRQMGDVAPVEDRSARRPAGPAPSPNRSWSSCRRRWAPAGRPPRRARRAATRRAARRACHSFWRSSAPRARASPFRRAPAGAIEERRLVHWLGCAWGR